MADIVFKYDEMRTAATQIADISARYKAASDKFQADFADAVSAWEGASKDKMMMFINGPVNEYMGTTVPGIVNALAEPNPSSGAGIREHRAGKGIIRV